MKDIACFHRFMVKSVNLDNARLKNLNTKRVAVETLLRQNFGDSVTNICPQGSWAFKTIIQPTDGLYSSYDLDLALFLKPIKDPQGCFKGWAPKDYILKLREYIKNNGRYTEKTGKQTRCVTIEYAEQFHMDIVPHIVSGEAFFICNSNENTFEKTDGLGLQEWWHRQVEKIGQEHLVQVMRLLKFIRDKKKSFSIKSVTFLVLLGRVADAKKKDLHFDDLPTAFKTIVSLLDDWLQEHSKKPKVENPALKDENLARNWKEENYSRFRDCFHLIRTNVDAAYNEGDSEKSIKKWRVVFGDDFPDTKRNLDWHEIDLTQPNQDLLVSLDQYRCNFKHQKKLEYQCMNSMEHCLLSAEISSSGKPLMSGEIVSKGVSLQFTLSRPKEKIARTQYILWQVVNTGEEAMEKQDLRGEFDLRSGGQHYRTETASYSGIHWIQAYLLDPLKRVQGVTERFFVVIK